MTQDASSTPAGISLLGTQLGNYRITGEISVGGMGTVYRAEHTLLGRPAAVKLLRPELTTSEELVERFFNEAKAATAIRHPGIVEVYDFGYTSDGKAYLVMELLEGIGLEKKLEQGPLSEADTAWIARGISSALKAAHAKGIIHRDLKPDNVYVVPEPDDARGRIKLLDFGIAKLEVAPETTRHTVTGALMGTPLYMAPEQARAARTIDHRADLYSLGCMMYEMLAGTPPFIAEGAGEIIAMHLFAQPEALSARVPGISADMERIVTRLLAKEPGDRYPTAQSVIDDLASSNLASSSRSHAVAIEHASPNASTLRPGGAVRLSLIDDDQPSLAQTRSSMPIIAAAITLAIAGVVTAVVLLRSSSDDPKPPETEGSAGSSVAAPNPPAPPTTRPRDPKTTPKPVPDVPIIVEAPNKQPHKRTKPVVTATPKTTTDSTGPVTRPGDSQAAGPTTDQGSPIETTLDDKPKTAPAEPPKDLPKDP